MPTGLAIPGTQGDCKFRAMTSFFKPPFVLFENRSQLTQAVVELVFVTQGDLELLILLPPLNVAVISMNHHVQFGRY